MGRQRARAVALVLLLASGQEAPAAQSPPASDRARRLSDAVGLLDGGRAADAKLALEHVLEDARAAGDGRIEGGALGQLARALQALGDLAGADRRFAEAEAVLTGVGDPSALGVLLNARGLSMFGRGRPEVAEDFWRRALEQFERAGRPREQASVLHSLTFVRRQDSAEVIALLERGLALARGAGARDIEGLILQRWGDEHVLQGDYGSALRKIEVAVAVLDQAGRPAQRARALTSLGRVYRMHGNYDLALEAFERALALHRASSDVAGIGQSMNAVAVALRVLGRTADAVAAARGAVAFLESRGDKTGTLALAWQTLATALEDGGRPGEALAAVERGLAAGPTPSDRPMLLLTRASLLLASGRNDEATAPLADAEALAGGRQDIKGMLLLTRAELRARAGDIAGALDDSASALRLYEAQRANAAPVDGLKAGFDNVHQWAWAQRVRLLADAGRDAEALEAAEGARARAFLDLLGARRLPAQTSTGGLDGAAPDRRGVDATRMLASPVATASPGLAEIAAHAARLQSTVISYWVERDRVRIWAVDGAARIERAQVAVDARRLEQLVRATWSTDGAKARAGDGAGGAARAAPAGGSARALRELHELLVAPIAHALPRDGSRRLTIVPHGPLFRLSFAALLGSSGRYLIEDHEIHYTPSLGVLGATAALSGHAAPAGALVVAAPTMGDVLASEGLEPLPGAVREGRAVARLIGESSSRVLGGSHATQAEVRRLAGGRRVLHFATHAVVSDDHPLDSYLALSPDRAGNDGDGRFTAEEVYDLRLDADLVVLSACRTAGGRVTGDGINGLARAFVYAGTPSLVATLWDLPDIAGAFVLPRFYQQWTGAADKAASLRTSQLALLRALRAGRMAVDTPAGRFVLPEHPSLWAGLVLVGEP